MNGKLDPARADRAVTRSATSGFQKPTTPHDRHERKLAKLHAWVETQSCREIANTEWTRGELACCHCLASQYYLPSQLIAKSQIARIKLCLN